MSDEEARRVYAEARLGQPVALGVRPAVLVVDFSCGFTDPACAVGSELSDAVEATAGLLRVARERGVPVIFTTIGFEASLADGGLWLQKMPGLADLQVGGPWVEIDPRLGRRADETVVLKKGASAFFGTNLTAILVSQGIDTVVLCGATTSGCIRATAVDLLQNGFPTLVPRECGGGGARAPRHATRFGFHARGASVVSVEAASACLASARNLP